MNFDKRMLHRFLKENNLMQQYYFYIKKDRQENFNKVVNRMFASKDIRNRIRAPFMWSTTPQGFYFWKAIHRNWCKVVLATIYGK